MRQLPVALLICGGCAVVIAGDWRGDLRLLGLGFLIALWGSRCAPDPRRRR